MGMEASISFQCFGHQKVSIKTCLSTRSWSFVIIIFNITAFGIDQKWRLLGRGRVTQGCTPSVTFTSCQILAGDLISLCHSFPICTMKYNPNIDFRGLVRRLKG